MGKVSLIFTKFAFGSWRRIAFLNKYLCEFFTTNRTWFIPVFFVLSFRMYFKSSDRIWTAQDYIRRVSQLQRFWLTASSHGLSLQPSFLPLYLKICQENTKFRCQNQVFRQQREWQNLWVEFHDTPSEIRYLGAFRIFQSKMKNVNGRSVRILWRALLMSFVEVTGKELCQMI